MRMSHRTLTKGGLKDISSSKDTNNSNSLRSMAMEVLLTIIPRGNRFIFLTMISKAFNKMELKLRLKTQWSVCHQATHKDKVSSLLREGKDNLLMQELFSKIAISRE